MGCYVSRQMQVVAEEMRSEEAKNLVLDPSSTSQSMGRVINQISSRALLQVAIEESQVPKGEDPTTKETGAEAGESTRASVGTSRTSIATDRAVVFPDVPQIDAIPIQDSQVKPLDGPEQEEELTVQQVVEQVEEEEHPIELPSWTKTACCGRGCQVSNSRFCCEHDFTKPVELYCYVCRERYEEWQDANQAFEELVHEMEERLRTSGKMRQESSGTGSREEHPMDDHPLDDGEFSTSRCSLGDSQASRSYISTINKANKVLPCGHLARQSHVFMLDPCPVCQNKKGFWDFGGDVRRLGNLGTQTGRYQVMHSPTKAGTANTTAQRPSTKSKKS